MLVREHSMLFNKTILFYGYCTDPTTGGNGSFNTKNLTPPSSMRVGDLCVMTAYYNAGGTRTVNITSTGGQSWSSTYSDKAGGPGIRTWWCTFNGTWSSALQVVIVGSAGISATAVMCVWRPPLEGAVWAVDQAYTVTTSGGGASITVTGITNTRKNNLTVCKVVTRGSGFGYGSVSGSNWQQGPSHWTEALGPIGSLWAFQVQGFRNVPVGATGNVTITPSSSVGTDYNKNIMSFYYN